MYSRNGRITLITLSIIITAAFLISSLISFQTAKKSLRNEVKNSSLPLLSENIYSELQKTLSTPINVSVSMTQDSFLINWIKEGEINTDEIQLYLQNLKEKNGFFSTFFVSETTRNYYYYDGILKQISPIDSHDVWYYDFKKSGKDIDLDVDTDEASSGILTIFINCRLHDFDNTFLGVVGVGIKVEEITEFLLEKKTKYKRQIYLVDESGYIQVHADSRLIEKSNLYIKEGISEVAEDLMTTSIEPVDRTYKLRGEAVLVSSRYIPELNWHVIVEQQEKNYYSDARRSLYINLLMTIIISGLLFTVSYRVLKAFETQMETIAGTDSLTNIANRREFEKQFEIYKYRAERYDIKISLLLIDLDNFKRINDESGHIAGDNVLKQISSLILESIRPVDTVARWGGDEFILLMEGNSDTAVSMSKRFRTLCESRNIPVTLSVGVTEYIGGESLNECIQRADKALYESKQKGKNSTSLS